MTFKKLLKLSLAASLATALVYSEASTATTRQDAGKLRVAWLKFEACREAAVAKNQEAQLERCLATALPSSASLMEKQKAVEFLNQDLKLKEIFECPSSLSEARGKKTTKQANQDGTQYGCFEIKLSGPSVKGEIEFKPEPDGTFRVRKIRYGF
jgi:hypothetical protein